ncbi:MAG TPA: hypothetical protein VKB46_05950, partial [Pyrinomonadaceae bacterium]|nr:hypothetical protein [Pyrinomonadaceae bacterium]
PVPVADQVTFSSNYSLSNFSVSENGVLVFWSGTGSSRQLVWFDRNGKQLGVAGPPGEYNDITLAPDEKRLAIQVIDGAKADLWLMDLVRGALSRFTFGNYEDDPVWSPDGNTIAFSSTRDSIFDIYRKQSSGAKNEEPVFKSGEGKETTDWSSDGRFLLYDRYDLNNGPDIWTLPLFGEGKPYPLLQSPFQEDQGHFSPDGHWFAYTSNESGRKEVYVQSFPQSGGKWQISTAGGAQPHWRGDSKEIFYIGLDRKLMAVDLTFGESLVASSPQSLFQTQVNRFDAPNRYVAARDGQRFLVNSPVEQASTTPITVVLNWTAGLKK